MRRVDCRTARRSTPSRTATILRCNSFKPVRTHLTGSCVVLRDRIAGTAILAVDLVSANTPRSLMRRSHGDSMDDDLPFLIDTVTSNASLVARDRTSGDVVDPSLAAARAYLSRAFPRVKCVACHLEEEGLTMHRPLLGVSLQTYLPRNPSSSPTSTVYFPFTTPSGSYRVLLRALKLYGDPRRADSYSTYLSEVFEVRRSL